MPSSGVFESTLPHFSLLERFQKLASASKCPRQPPVTTAAVCAAAFSSSVLVMSAGSISGTILQLG